MKNQCIFYVLSIPTYPTSYMSSPYEKNKKYVYKWRKKNPERNRVNNLKAGQKRCQWLKIQRIFFKILL